MRTHEQVVADVEKRFKELKEEKRLQEEEMAKPKHTKPCTECRHFVLSGLLGACNNPLIRGIDKPISFYNPREYPRTYRKEVDKLSVCLGAEERDHCGVIVKLGYEQALWEPRLTRFQKFINRWSRRDRRF